MGCKGGEHPFCEQYARDMSKCPCSGCAYWKPDGKTKTTDGLNISTIEGPGDRAWSDEMEKAQAAAEKKEARSLFSGSSIGVRRSTTRRTQNEPVS